MAKLKGIVNFRDLAESSGGLIEKGRIFRSATPAEATEEDKRYLIDELKIKTVIDLRTIAESSQDSGEKIFRREFVVLSDTNVFRQDLVNNLRSSNKKILFQLPVLPTHLSFLKELTSANKCKLVMWEILRRKDKSNKIICDMMTNLKLEGLYRLMLRTSWRNILRALEICSDPDNYPLLIHCTQGKDRTGMVTAMILNCCGVDQKLIVEDYTKSEKELEPLRLDPTYMKRNFPKAEQLGLDMTSWMLAPQEAFESAMKYIETNYGDVPGYLDWIGFTSSMRFHLKQKLLVSDQELERLQGGTEDTKDLSSQQRRRNSDDSFSIGSSPRRHKHSHEYNQPVFSPITRSYSDTEASNHKKSSEKQEKYRWKKL